MKKAIKYIYNANPFYIYFKKHFCPRCASKLKLKYFSKIVNSNSEEASKYDFSVGDTFFTGNVEFRTIYLHCSKCQLDITLKQMKEYEKKKK